MNRLFRLWILICVLAVILSGCDDGVQRYENKVEVEGYNLLFSYQVNPTPGFSTILRIKDIGDNGIIREISFGGKPDPANELISAGHIIKGNIYTSNNVLILLFSEGGIETLSLHPSIYQEYNEEQLLVYSLLLKLPGFQWWYNFSELFIKENNYEVIDIIHDWAKGYFTDDIINNTTAGERTEATKWAREIVEKYHL